jgi:hypothetical protein
MLIFLFLNFQTWFAAEEHDHRIMGLPYYYFLVPGSKKERMEENGDRFENVR